MPAIFENGTFYTIKEAATICGCSRSTILRLEDLGFFTPAYINPETGYRYYDVYNILRISRYQMFREVGVPQKDIVTYYNGDLVKSGYLNDLKKRISLLQRYVNRLEDFFSERGRISFSYFDLREIIAYPVPSPTSILRDCGDLAYRTMQQMIDAGFHPDPMSPIFLSTPDTATPYTGKTLDSTGSLLCLAVQPDSIPDPTKVITFPKRRAYTMTYHGNSDDVLKNAGHTLYTELRRRGMRAVGPLYTIGMVTPFFGEKVAPEDNVFRFAIPVES